MQKNKVNATGNSVNLKALCTLIRNGRFQEAVDNLMHTQGPESEERDKEQLLGSVLYWKGKMDAASKLDHYAQSEFLISEWATFLRDHTGGRLPDPCLFALKHYVYSIALRGYLELYNQSGICDPDVLLMLGKVYKGLGDYERAVQSLEIAAGEARNDARILFQLADCYAAVDEGKKAKLFFREAFFLDPAAFNPDECEAQFIAELSARVREDGRDPAHVAYWIPVYGTILGVFNIKRELKPVEIGKLSHSLRELEKRLPDGLTERETALLLNGYFRMIDHLLTIKAPREDIDELLAAIDRVDHT
ncbi:MAG TPA: hypothetical protein ENN69_00610, partial [Spirochaetia bacterium]|nr:hypothetical protein [Spirochaetia bacterium]